MVDTISPVGEADRYAAIAALMRRKPVSSNSYATTADYEAARVAWLFEMADAMDRARLRDDAESVLGLALRAAHAAVTDLAGGEAR